MLKQRPALVIGGGVAALLAGGAYVLATIIPLTFRDLFLSGTQIGNVSPLYIGTSDSCQFCHSDYDEENEPYATWHGSKMSMAGRNPLFYAQMTLANQDTDTAGYFCLRCHVPMSFVTGNAADPTGNSLDHRDFDGVSCHFCHSMVDPIYRPGVSPVQDLAVLKGLTNVPRHYGNSMFVLDPTGTRRGTLADPFSPHDSIYSPFHMTGSMCGTCHDVGNVAVSRQPDGSYRYNELDQPTPDEDLWTMFPLERTYTEWKLSAFARGGVSMGGRFGGHGADVVSTCQDCHMPRVEEAQVCAFGPMRPGVRRHDFAGSGAQVLDIIAEFTRGDPTVNQYFIKRARAKAVRMLELAASLQTSQTGPWLNVRVINETGHKIPTGHIEGRRIWVNVRFYDAAGNLLREHGGYDDTTAELDELSTRVYEMRVGLSEYAASVTGLPAGPTGHMALADTIVKDNRIPPRGYNFAEYYAGGAHAVGHHYADGQHWDDTMFNAPQGTARASVRIYYQSTPKFYIEELLHGNHTNHWGQTLYDLWVRTGKGAPILMAQAELDMAPACPADWNADGIVEFNDFLAYLQDYNAGAMHADLNLDGIADFNDILEFLNLLYTPCP